MKKALLILGMIAFGFATQAQTSDLIGMLTKEMGISNEQAEGGAGALFGMAKETMDKSSFGDLSKIIPNMGGLLDAVPSLGGKKSMFGGLADKITGMPAVLGAFEKLGLSETHVKLMTPLLVNYVEDKGGKVLSEMFAKSILK